MFNFTQAFLCEIKKLTKGQSAKEKSTYWLHYCRAQGNAKNFAIYGYLESGNGLTASLISHPNRR